MPSDPSALSSADPASARPADDPQSWYAQPVLTGELIRLEPMRVEDAPGYLAAAGAPEQADEVFRWLSLRPPRTVADAGQHIHAALAARARGERLPYTQIDTRTGAVAGTTSLYEINPAARTAAIGHTWLGRPWWRSGHNTESKLLLLSYLFDQLGAVRVVWHTDIYNDRSQRAIERLGAGREGVLRKHRIRRDATWRDTVQYAMTDDDWPTVRQHLAARLAQG